MKIYAFDTYQNYFYAFIHIGYFKMYHKGFCKMCNAYIGFTCSGSCNRKICYECINLCGKCVRNKKKLNILIVQKNERINK